MKYFFLTYIIEGQHTMTIRTNDDDDDDDEGAFYSNDASGNVFGLRKCGRVDGRVCVFVCVSVSEQKKTDKDSSRIKFPDK